MQKPQEARPRAVSPFTAAFLSLLFPGLGQAYAGAYARALGFAAVPILLIALGAGVFLRLDLACGPCQRRVCALDHRCMRGIETRAVLDACVRLLDGQALQCAPGR